MIETISYTLVPSAFGPVGIAWREIDREAKVWHVFLSQGATRAEDRLAAAYPGCCFASDPAVNRVADRVKRFLAGEAVIFDLSSIALERCTAFQRRVLLAEYAIPRGQVSTYGRIAAHLGVPHGARAVGNALAHNPFPLVIPCHRAIRSNGTLGGYQGGPEMKRRLLQMEGVQVSSTGHVVDTTIYY
ncbi:MAG: methylated-DNA--[protein]-cysteine S-methyltransferase [Anaerolineae bacterium]